MLLMSLLLFTPVITSNGQDTPDTIRIDTLEIDTLRLGSDTMEVQEEFHDIMIEQRQMNTEIKRQLDFLKNIIDEEEKKKDPNK